MRGDIRILVPGALAWAWLLFVFAIAGGVASALCGISMLGACGLILWGDLKP